MTDRPNLREQSRVVADTASVEQEGRGGVSAIPAASAAPASREWIANFTACLSDYSLAVHQDGTHRRAMSDETRATHERLTELIEELVREVSLLELRIHELEEKA